MARLTRVDLDGILVEAYRAFQGLAPDGFPAPASLEALDAAGLVWETWPQTWPNTACGYPARVVGHGFTRAMTVIVRSARVPGTIAVFFGRPELAYLALDDSPGWQRAYRCRCLPAVKQSDYVTRVDHQAPPPWPKRLGPYERKSAQALADALAKLGFEVFNQYEDAGGHWMTVRPGPETAL
jgi:hypothetical protein